jgi:hypothetical protein
MAAELPREKLKELVEKNGDSLLQDRDRCEGLLKDYCGGHRREISALVGALEERVPLELKSPWQAAMTPEAMRARLVQRLEDHRGLAPEIASYAVDTWSYALGVGLGRSTARVEDMPAPPQNGFSSVAGARGPAAADRPDGSISAAIPLVPTAIAGWSKQTRAIVAGVGLMAVIAMASTLLHHPRRVSPPPPSASPPAHDDHDQPPAPAPVPGSEGKDETAVHDGQTGGNTAADRGKTGQPAKSFPGVPAPATVAVRLDSDFDSDEATAGEMLPATVVTPVTSGGNVVVPRGAPAHLKVVRIDKSGKLSGKSEVEFALVGLTSRGKWMRVSSSPKTVDGLPQGVKTAERTGIGGAAGAAIGAITGHLFHHAGTGALAGAGAGGATGALTSHPAPVKVSAETVLRFRLGKGIPARSE